MNQVQVLKEKYIDNNLKVVMGTLRGEYGTWIYNKSSNSFEHGHYFKSDKEAAEKDFYNRH